MERLCNGFAGRMEKIKKYHFSWLDMLEIQDYTR